MTEITEKIDKEKTPTGRELLLNVFNYHCECSKRSLSVFIRFPSWRDLHEAANLTVFTPFEINQKLSLDL
jgi:hypothetical protein